MTAENQMTGKTGEVGRLLKAAREETRQNLRDVAERLRIRYQFLEAIEEGRYQDLPGAAYATGFVRAYAEYLGLDGLEIARRFKEEGVIGKMGSELAFPIPAAESGLPSRSLLLAGVAMLGVVYGVWHFVGSPDKPLADVVQDIPDRIAALMRSTPDSEEALKREPVIAPASETPATPAAAPVPAPAPAPQGVAAPAAVPPASGTPAVAPQASVPPAPPAKPAHSETAQEPISTAEADIQPPAEDHDDPPATVTPLPAPTAALPSVPPVAAPAPAPASPSAVPAKPVAAPVPATQSPVPQAVATPAKPVPPVVTPPPAPAAPAAAPGSAIPPAKPTAPTVAAPSAPVPVAKPVAPPASPLAALPSTPTASAAPAGGPARVEPTTAPVERQGTDAGAEAATGQGRVFGEENGGARVVLKARADSWVQVRNSDGLLMSRLLRKGDSYLVPNQGGLELMTGNAGGLDIVVDGKALPTLGKTGEVRKGIPLQAEALKSGAAGTP